MARTSVRETIYEQMDNTINGHVFEIGSAKEEADILMETIMDIVNDTNWDTETMLALAASIIAVAELHKKEQIK